MQVIILMRRLSAVLLMLSVVVNPASAQVVLDMPAPPKSKSSAVVPSIVADGPATNGASGVTYRDAADSSPSVGAVALYRYARVRSTTRNSYYVGYPYQHGYNSYHHGYSPYFYGYGFYGHYGYGGHGGYGHGLFHFGHGFGHHQFHF